MRRQWPFAMLPLALLLAGCADATYEAGETKSVAVPSASPEFRSMAMPDAAAASSMMGMTGAEPPTPTEEAPAGEKSLGAGTAAETAGLPRKIIYNADISLIVDDFAASETKVADLVRSAHGYIAEMQVYGSPGSARSARWKLRVPVEGFEDFVSSVAGLGEIDRNSRTSEDVTETFYDIEARVKNKQVEEERLQKILEDATGKLDDILQVERELSRVRGEVEGLQGRLRVLANLTSLTTVVLAIKEREKYSPPPPAAATFSMRIRRTFQGSLDRISDLGEAIVLFFVAISVWLPILLVLALFGWLIIRMIVRLARPPARLTPRD